MLLSLSRARLSFGHTGFSGRAALPTLAILPLHHRSRQAHITCVVTNAARFAIRKTAFAEFSETLLARPRFRRRIAMPRNVSAIVPT